MEDLKGKSFPHGALHQGLQKPVYYNSSQQCLLQSYIDNIWSFASPDMGSENSRKQDENKSHQRAHSENPFTEGLPSWFEELLNEPETPVCKGHRRSSSESAAFMKDCEFSRDTMGLWGSTNIDHCNELWNSSLFITSRPIDDQQSWAWKSPSDTKRSFNGYQSSRVISPVQYSLSLANAREANGRPSKASAKKNQKGSGGSNAKDKRFSENPTTKPSAPKTEANRTKQQYAQRSRVRKLQYIAELERSVQFLQVEGAELIAELEFLHQNNRMLDLENRVLRERLLSLSQEQHAKCLNQNLLEREVERLRILLEQQQQKQCTAFPPKFRDLDLQLANLSLKHQEASF